MRAKEFVFWSVVSFVALFTFFFGVAVFTATLGNKKDSAVIVDSVDVPNTTTEQWAAWRYNLRVNIIPAFGSPMGAIMCGFRLDESPPATYELPFTQVQEVFQEVTMGENSEVLVWGFYDPEQEKVYVTNDAGNMQNILVHEYLHVFVNHNILEPPMREFCLSELIAREGEHVFALQDQLSSSPPGEKKRKLNKFDGKRKVFGLTRGIWWHGVEQK